MSFLIYDVVLLILFLITFAIIFYKKKKGFKREGIMLLYRTQWGVKLIEKIGKKYKRTLKVLSYISITVGYLLMIGILWLIYRIVKIYIFQPAVVKAIKIPPITPIFPYINKLVPNLGLPNFYFTYFIIIIAIIAISHEMAHGIFAIYHKIKIKTTGFAFVPYFFPIFPAAFVEQDEKSMEKSSKFAQMSVLSAGTFANVIVAIFFSLILWGFFAVAFAPAGITYDSYATSQIPVAAITSINGTPVSNYTYSNLINSINGTGEVKITAGNTSFIVNKQILESQSGMSQIIVYNDAPAINANLSSVILDINGKKVTSLDELQNELNQFSPGQSIVITEETNSGKKNVTITLGENPLQPGHPFLGIGFIDASQGGLMGTITSAFSVKRPHVYYVSTLGGFSLFIYNLLWWLILLSITVALVNMLPVGIFDGGRFFYLTIWGITKNEKFARKTFNFVTWFFIFLLFVMMIFWAASFF